MSDFTDATNEPKWYVAHTYSGYENKVKANLEKIVDNRQLHHMIQDIRIPTEIVQENDGVDEEGNVKTKEIENKLLPSYVLIKMIMTDATWHVVRNISGVTGFVGPGSKPTPLSDAEVERIGIEKKEISLEFNVGDSVEIISGSLSGFTGKVLEISDDKKKIKILASMFGRETAVELDSENVKPLNA